MQWTKKLVGNENERAVSPVIGVILMVAITVILAAVIAAFVLDLGPSETDPQAAVQIDGDGTTEATVTLQSVAQGEGIMVFGDDGTSDIEGYEHVSTITVTGSSEDFSQATTTHTDYVVVAFSGSDSTDDLGVVDESSATNIVIIEEFTVS